MSYSGLDAPLGPNPQEKLAIPAPPSHSFFLPLSTQNVLESSKGTMEEEKHFLQIIQRHYVVAHTCDLITFGMRQKEEDLCEFKASLDCLVLAPGQPQLQCESLSQKTQTKQTLDFFSRIWDLIKTGRGGGAH